LAEVVMRQLPLTQSARSTDSGCSYEQLVPTCWQNAPSRGASVGQLSGGGGLHDS
jgi:hypothetical protein